MFKLSMKTDNAAFEDEGLADEIGRILKNVAGFVRNGFTSGRCVDVNGNHVGDWEINDE